MMKWITGLALMLLAVSCAPSINIREDKDDFQGTRYYTLMGSTTTCTYRPDIELGVQKVVGASSNSSFYLIIRYSSPEWLFIDSGQSLSFLLDQYQFSFSGEGSRAYRKVFSGSVSETAFYLTDSAFIKTLVNAKQVRLQIRGSRGRPECTLTDAGKAAFVDFYQRHVDLSK